MGNAASNFTAYGKLARELPPLKSMGHDDDWKYVDLGMEVFADEKDREQFIHAILAVSTANGTLDLSGADYKLFYSRRAAPSAPQSPSPSDPAKALEDHLIATIAAVREGKIIAKIEPAAGGATQREAFLALRRDVEIKLDRLLQSVPSASDPVTGVGSSGQGMPSDMPPSYQSSAVGMGRGVRKEKT